MIRLIALVPKPSGLSPGQRFRLEQWAPRLKSHHGIEIDFVPFESPRMTEIVYKKGYYAQKAALVLYNALRRGQAVLSARNYDGAVIYREAAAIGPAIYERLLSRMGVPFYFDFDDAIWVPTSSVNGIFSKLHFWGKTSTICRLSRAVFVGNEYLAAFARQHNPEVFVIPTTIDLSRYTVQPPPEAEPLVVVWSGSVHTLPHLEAARPALEKLGEKRKFVLQVICNEPPARPFANVETRFVPWREASEVEDLAKAHVGIMPLPDDPFARGKCGLKALQYMAIGRPVVCSPVGVNSEIIRSGENGFLASTVDEWVAALEQLASPDVRARLGAAARKTIERAYTTEIAAERFATAVRATLSAHGASSRSWQVEPGSI